MKVKKRSRRRVHENTQGQIWAPILLCIHDFLYVFLDDTRTRLASAWWDDSRKNTVQIKHFKEFEWK